MYKLEDYVSFNHPYFGSCQGTIVAISTNALRGNRSYALSMISLHGTFIITQQHLDNFNHDKFNIYECVPNIIGMRVYCWIGEQSLNGLIYSGRYIIGSSTCKPISIPPFGSSTCKPISIPPSISNINNNNSDQDNAGFTLL